MPKQKFIINQELNWSSSHYMKDCWLIHNGVPNNGARTLWKDGTIHHPASGNLYPHDQIYTLSGDEKRRISLESQQSAWCATKEEAIAVCEKYGYPYQVKE